MTISVTVWTVAGALFVDGVDRDGIGVEKWRMRTGPGGRLMWVSPAPSGAVHDVTATRMIGLIDALSSVAYELVGLRDTGVEEGA